MRVSESSISPPPPQLPSPRKAQPVMLQQQQSHVLRERSSAMSSGIAAPPMDRAARVARYREKRKNRRCVLGLPGLCC